MVCVVKGLVVFQSSLMDVNLGYTRNVLVLKVDWQLTPSIDVKDVWGFADRWVVDLKSM